ncbi:MAG: DUF3604 domain-containing protein [Bryobacteraceae bacterium]|jgi:hypothetical protein
MKASYVLALAGIVVLPAMSQSPAPNPLRNAYFGDLHVHTSYSLDAYTLGNRNDPRAAYRFGRGEPITLPGNVKSQLRVPLDFMAVTDHDIWLGELALCTDPNEAVYATDVCRTIRESDKNPRLAMAAVLRFGLAEAKNPAERDASVCGTTNPAAGVCNDRAKSVWHELQQIAQEYYEPGKFTTFIGFEWTANLDRIGMLHRNVIFRGTTVPDVVASAVELNNRPERLWEWLEKTCTGDCQALAIPHNTNFGWGVALDAKNSDGTPFTKEILQRRARTEPLIEIFQQKGNSECAPGLGTTDEQCSFEQVFEACKNGETAFCAVASDYVRNALKTGLVLGDQFGVNPFQYGFIADTDTHLSNAGQTEEKDQPAYGIPINDKAPLNKAFPINMGAFNPGGLAGVWAEQNTRESIFDSLRRRETFATSGTRIRVRLFGGWNYPAGLDKRRDLVQAGYKGGVPMGGELHGARGTAPKLVVWAVKDSNSANLQKIQIVKGWSKGAETFEKVFDVACSDGLRPDPKSHKCPDNGASVSLSDCSTTENEGAAELSATWSDPEFDKADRAFYYARVLENPTCRWSTHAALQAKVALPTKFPSTIQERAWSSPIWYTPEGH